MNFTYDRNKLVMDAGRGGLGLIGSVAPILLVDAILPVVAYILWALAALFLLFLLRVADRWFSHIEMTEEDITLTAPGRQRHLAWSDLKSVRFSCYTVRRGSQTGAQVMTLKLSGAGTKIVVESSLTGFDKLLDAVSSVCGHYRPSVDPTSAHNFAALGVPIPQQDGG